MAEKTNETPATEIASAIAGVVADSATGVPAEETTKKTTKEVASPTLSEEGEFLVRRIVEGVSKAIAEMTAKDDSEDDSPKRRRKASTPKPEEKRSVFSGLFKSPFKRG